MVAIVDYGVGNLYSLTSSFRAIGVTAVATGDKKVIESAEKIINHNYPEKELLFCLYQKGFEFLENQSLQNIVDVGAFGLALAIKREAGKNGK